MVEISKCKDRCFAELHTGCKILTTECEGKDNCPFYKPVDCESWIRKEVKGKVYIMPPEEYYEV